VLEAFGRFVELSAGLLAMTDLITFYETIIVETHFKFPHSHSAKNMV